MKRSLVSFLFLLLWSFALGQDSVAIKYASVINVDRLASHIAFLASDSLEGRLIGEEGHHAAALFISEQFRQNGLKAPVDSYFQEFDVIKSYWSDIYIRSGEKVYRNLLDGIIYLGARNIAEEKEFKMNFIGNAIDNGQLGQQSTIYYNTPYWISLRREYSEDLKTSFSIIIDNTHTKNFDSIACLMNKPFETAFYAFPDKAKPVEDECASAFLVSEKVASTLFNMKDRKIRRIGSYSGRKLKRVKRFDPVDITVKAERRYDTLRIANVVAFIEGAEKKDEVVAITAHYDHLGIVGNQLFPGADDNASGVAAMLEIARVFQKAKSDGQGPKRSVLFISFTGEEKGLFGSEYYVNHPAVPMEKTIANLNIDMIGRVDERNGADPEYVYLIGSDKISQELHALSERVNNTYTGLRLDYTYNSDDDPNRYYYRSDHYNFAKHGVPAIFYFNGAHADYHQPTDTIEKIEYDALMKRTHLIFHTAWSLVNAEERPLRNAIETP